MRLLSRARGGAGSAMKRCDFYWVDPRLAEGDRPPPAAVAARLQRMQAQRLHEAGAAGAGAQRRHRGERVAHDDAPAELFGVACGSNNDAGQPRRVRAQPPAVDEAEQGFGEGERRAPARPARSRRRWPRPRANGAMPT